MNEQGSVSAWLGQLKAGDREALQPLWERYFARLVALTRGRLQGCPRGVADEEDVALSAFDDFRRGVEQGRFPRLEDRSDLWQVLMLLTRQKAANLVKHERRQKRGSGQVRHLSALATGDSPSSADAFHELFGPEPTPDFAAQVAEECRRLLDGLGDARLREVAVWKMEGYTNEEIARQLGCSLATVERKLSVIRKAWEREIV
jgi:DNA-directed RNA polymerase specialized sigma24 family protein